MSTTTTNGNGLPNPSASSSSSSSQQQHQQPRHHSSSSSSHSTSGSRHSSGGNGTHSHSHHSSSSGSGSSQQQHKRPSTSSSTPSKDASKPPSTISNTDTSDFACYIRYQNNLPDIPFEPKFIQVPSDFSRFTQYKNTSLEKNYKQPLLTDPHLGIPIDLIDLAPQKQQNGTSTNNNGKQSKPQPQKTMAPEDLALLRTTDDTNGTSSPSLTSQSRVALVRPAVAWLRKTEYLSTHDNQLGRPAKRQSTGTPNKAADETSGDMLKNETDIELVENTFFNIKNITQFQHPTKPDLRPVSVLPVFPDFDMWTNEYAEVVFDSDPLDLPPPTLKGQEFTNYIIKQQEIRSRGVIKGISDKFVYFLAPKNNLDNDLINNNNNNKNNNSSIDNNSEGDYKMYKVFTNDIFHTSDENYFLTVKEDGVYYNRLNTRVNLKRVKSRDDKILEKRSIGRPEYVTYETRELTEQEIQDKKTLLDNLLQEAKAPFSDILTNNNQNKRKII